MLAFKWFWTGPVKQNLKHWDVLYLSVVLHSEAAYELVWLVVFKYSIIFPLEREFYRAYMYKQYKLKRQTF